MRATTMLISFAVLAAIGCNSQSTQTQAETPATTEPAAAAESEAGVAMGKVVETMDSGGYTYVLVNIAGDKVWAAGPVVKVAVGDSVSFAGGLAMRNYHSKTLDRTFELVYFVQALTVGAGG